jgi:PRC-barrel domain
MDTDSNLHTARPLESRETHALIGSDKVEGTAVYRSNGDKIGHIARVMIDKLSGKVAYAVMSFGGFMGIGEDYYPLPWSLLTYNPRLEGYEVNVSDQQLKGAPKYSTHESWDWNRRGQAPTLLGCVTSVTALRRRLRRRLRPEGIFIFCVLT